MARELTATTGTAAARTTRLLATGALTIMLLAVATPAAAHTRAAASSNYDSRILTTPDIPGAAWRLYAGGDIIELTHRGSAELIVLGYADEPYLRLGPAGTFENRNSPATYLNADRYGDVAVPPRADPSAAPEWRKVSDEPTWTWHDHRVHWMSPEPPPVVRDDPGRRTLISGWTVPVEHDGAALELAGQLWWTPGPASWPYLAMGLLVTSPAAAGLVARARGRRLRRPAAAMTATVAALNGIHFLDELLAWPAPTLDVVFGVFHTALFVGMGLIGAAIAWRGRFGPNLSLGIAS
ncbi:MAG TPA: hypothetical protein VK891_08435, partial [Euzebyales bacterium]|nr:hypothetical protein [Euzebyales bacterium]